MRPSKVFAFEERRLGRPLTGAERAAISKARDDSGLFGQDATNVMRAVLGGLKRGPSKP
jgi:hypothetical protein